MVLFPNPATSTLNLKFNFIQSGKLEAIIFNSLGQQTSLVQTIDCSAGKDDVSTFNTASLAVANYILYLKYTDDKGNITEGNLRFIISK